MRSSKSPVGIRSGAMRPLWSLLFALAAAASAVFLLPTGGTGFGTNAVTILGGQIVRMDYASDGVTVGGTFDFQVTSVDLAPNTTGFLNVVADLDSSGTITTDEWIVDNIPMFLDDGLTTQPLLSAWFDPGAFNLVVGASYETWATIETDEVADPSGYPSWHYSNLPSGGAVWGANDPNGEGGVPPPPAGTATSQGTMAMSKRGGVPDIAQQENECGPTSAANSLRWLAKKHKFEDKLPASDDELIKGLMKAMTGSDARPFPGLVPDQMFDGKSAYVAANKLPLVVKGGMADPNAVGGKAFDFIKKELDDGEDVEFLIDWPGGGSHWVTAVGYGINGDRLVLEVKDPDDGKTGAVDWELKRDGTFVNPKGTMNRAVSESYAAPPGIGGIVELAVDASGAPASATDGSGPSVPYAALAGVAAAAALVALAAGGWYARRRLS